MGSELPQRFVLLGASSDVAARYVLPALSELHALQKLPRGFELVAVTRKPWDRVEALRQHLHGQVQARRPESDPRDLRILLDHMRHVSANLADRDECRRVFGTLREPALFYVGLPPHVAGSVIEHLRGADLPNGCRIILEKPFGQNAESARKLNRALHAVFPESSIFRLDHFLGKRTAQNILGLRGANPILEPLWNRHHIQRVSIIWDEMRAPSSRIGYYDSAGAVTDMVQNHLLQLLCLVAMDLPPDFTEQAIRNRKFELIRQIRRYAEAEVGLHTVRARYTEGRVQGQTVAAYAEEQGVDPTRGTETFAQIRLFVDNARWRGVPFILRTGKALAEDRAEIAVIFKSNAASGAHPWKAEADNRLRLAFKPDRVGLTVNVSGSGLPSEATPVELSTEFAQDTMSPYAVLILNALHGDPTMFVRDDEAEEAWRIFDPILSAWRQGRTPLDSYPAGTDGPVLVRSGPDPHEVLISSRS